MRDAATQPYLGYVFYHGQDCETAARGGGLHLRYGTADGDAERVRAIGVRLGHALLAVGLRPEWSGDSTATIKVPLVWSTG